MAHPLRLGGSDGASELLLYPFGAAAEQQGVIEGGVYKFVFAGPARPRSYEPAELFEIDPDDRTMGRFRPANHVGTIGVTVELEDYSETQFELDVRPAKLTYESEYRALLEQVADHAAEAVLQGFAPASRLVSATTDEVGELDYRSLAFIAARLRDERFQAAVEQVLRAPHRRWRSVEESIPLGRGLPAGPGLVRQLSRARSQSQRTPAALAHLALATIPSVIASSRNEPTFDTNPNRFIRFVFRHWEGLAVSLERRLVVASGLGAGPRRRGLREARWVIDQCDRVLTSAVMQDVSELRRFPHGDPVLLRQPGYREVLRTFALAEASMALDTVLDDDIFSATQRNIATLYEYWTFLVLVRCLSQLCGEPASGSLFEPSKAGLSLVLREGSQSLMSWVHNQGGRRMAVDLWFNQTFSRAQSDGVEIASWASSIRPDASLRIRPLSGRPSEATDPFLDTWIHFDAKFRLDVQSSNIADEDPRSTAKRTDLLKMHAYRDLIRRSAGAYVLYPGFGTPQRRTEFHEVLPGIGAFPVRPGDGGTVVGADALIQFLSDTLELTSNQASANERTRFWQRKHTDQQSSAIQAVSFLSLPPADELVLLGYVRRAQRNWVLRRRRYNVRGDDRRGAVRNTDAMLTARLLLLWTHDEAGDRELVGLFERAGPWQIATAADLTADGYPPTPEAQNYLVTAINPVTSYVDALVAPIDRLLLPDDMAPMATTWEHVARSAG